MTRENTRIGRCLTEAGDIVNGARQDTYGQPEDSFKLIASYWSAYLEGCPDRGLTALDVAHMMVLLKLARCSGQTTKRDNYVDLCGYACIAADRLMPGTDALPETRMETSKPAPTYDKCTCPVCLSVEDPPLCTNDCTKCVNLACLQRYDYGG